MPRERFKTLTEQMFYILLCLHEECRGVDILEMVRTLTNGRVNIGSGTLYDLLEQFLKEGAIKETKAEGRCTGTTYLRNAGKGGTGGGKCGKGPILGGFAAGRPRYKGGMSQLF